MKVRNSRAGIIWIRTIKRSALSMPLSLEEVRVATLTARIVGTIAKAEGAAIIKVAAAIAEGARIVEVPPTRKEACAVSKGIRNMRGINERYFNLAEA
jgi:hypothetical protein